MGHGLRPAVRALGQACETRIVCPVIFLAFAVHIKARISNVNLPICPVPANEKFQKSSPKSVPKRGNLDRSVVGKLKLSSIFFENRKSKVENLPRTMKFQLCDSRRQKSRFCVTDVRTDTSHFPEVGC